MDAVVVNGVWVRQEPVFVEDIATDPLWANYRAFALPHGLRWHHAA